MNIQERIEALETEFAEKIKALKEEAQQGDEFPQEGYEFWFITSSGDVARMFWHDDLGQEQSLSIGNVFKTSEEAEFAVEKLKVEAELRKFSRPFKYGEDNLTLNYQHESKGLLNVAAHSFYQDIGEFYFDNNDKVNEARRAVGEDRIKKYIFRVED